MRMEVARVGSERVADDREMMQILRCHLVMNRRARRGAPGRVPRMHVLKTSRDLNDRRRLDAVGGPRRRFSLCAVINSCSSCASENEEVWNHPKATNQ